MSESVIYKKVYDLRGEPGDLVQTFEVPNVAELVAVDWDTRNQFGIAFWYRLPVEADAMTTWRLMVRGTGHEFPDHARHLATVTRDGFAWHLLDADGGHIRWAAR